MLIGLRCGAGPHGLLRELRPALALRLLGPHRGYGPAQERGLGHVVLLIAPRGLQIPGGA